jgi:hypothetical protein
VTPLESKYNNNNNNNNTEQLYNNEQYGGWRNMSSVPMVNPWCLVVAKKTPENGLGHL